MADDAVDCFVVELVDEADEVADEVGEGVLGQVGFVVGGVGVPAGRAAVAALVHGDAVVAGGGDGGEDFAPGEGCFRVAVGEEEEGMVGLAGAEDVEGEAAGGRAVDVVFCDASGEGERVKSGRVVHCRPGC